jgi:hypothetical protein
VPAGFVPVAITGCGGELPSREKQAAIEIEVGASVSGGGGRPTGAVRVAGGGRDGWPMIGLRPGLWIATQPIDFRRGMDLLAMLVSEAFGVDPYDGGLMSSAPSGEIA